MVNHVHLVFTALETRSFLRFVVVIDLMTLKHVSIEPLRSMLVTGILDAFCAHEIKSWPTAIRIGEIEETETRRARPRYNRRPRAFGQERRSRDHRAIAPHRRRRGSARTQRRDRSR